MPALERGGQTLVGVAQLAFGFGQSSGPNCFGVGGPGIAEESERSAIPEKFVLRGIPVPDTEVRDILCQLQPLVGVAETLLHLLQGRDVGESGQNPDLFAVGVMKGCGGEEKIDELAVLPFES